MEDKICPIMTANRDTLEMCAKGRCALWNETEECCSFTVMGRKAAAELIDQERENCQRIWKVTE